MVPMLRIEITPSVLSSMMRLRLGRSASSLIAFLDHATTVTEPPKFSTSSRVPGFTPIVVSTWAVARIVSAAAIIVSIRPSPRSRATGKQQSRSGVACPSSVAAHEFCDLAQQIHLATHLLDQVIVQVRIRRVGGESPPRLLRGAVDDAEIVLDHPHRMRVELLAVLVEHLLELGDG